MFRLAAVLAFAFAVVPAMASESCDQAAAAASNIALDAQNDFAPMRYKAVAGTLTASDRDRMNALEQTAYKKIESSLKTACNPGQVISFPRSYSGLTKTLCDFAKDIIVQNDETICVMRPREIK